MKTVLKISILINAALFGCLIFVAVKSQKPVTQPVSINVSETKPQATEVVPVTQPSASSVTPKPFRWSQLESADYSAYVKNLRGIGCPEPTIQAIVAADVHNHYNARYQQLEQKLTTLNNAPLTTRLASYKEQQALETELQKLPDEEASMAADFEAQASQPKPTQVAATGPVMQSKQTPILPLIFQNVDTAALNLNPAQLQEIPILRQNFLDAIGGPNQNPNDPAYLQHWQIAQPQTDEIAAGMFGQEAWMNYQLQAANQ